MTGDTPAPENDTAYVRDMLLSLREVASRNNHKLLVYFLEMAAFEAARLVDDRRAESAKAADTPDQDTRDTR